ncbi:hypothetical protein [Halorubrum sp. AJ67]|uniref:hypothetical protein n=1 Tax=Halorubrum sp. AJ67 TaxID=1173487 RepID=UPI0003DC8456|nr:hypothetical protein [Halorubrum sp. AJ67]CDK39017.1 pyrrolo-quinoline quinone [Halorubrum sp. AJ67]
MTDTPSRREWLAAVGAATTAAAAGCSSLNGTADDGTDSDPDPGSATEQTIPAGVAQFRGSLERWGYYPDETVPDAVETAWRIPEVNTGEHSAAKASAVPLSDGGVVLPGDTGELLAITADGDVRWRGETDMEGRESTDAGGRGRAGVYRRVRWRPLRVRTRLGRSGVVDGARRLDRVQPAVLRR